MTIIATQWREGSGFCTGSIDVFLDSEANPIEILSQPVILKPNASIQIGLRRCLLDQWLHHLEFMDDPRQHRPFTVSIGNSELNRQRYAKQAK
jgi:hypothetical protein